jgi:hypothetical protein
MDNPASAALETVEAVPPLARACEPVIHVAVRRIEVAHEADDGTRLELRFQPYQGLRLTTVDCFAVNSPADYTPGRLTCRRVSPWLDSLRAALRETAARARFMERALHFTLPAGDDVLEVVAWKVQIRIGGAWVTHPAEGGGGAAGAS